MPAQSHRLKKVLASMAVVAGIGAGAAGVAAAANNSSSPASSGSNAANSTSPAADTQQQDPSYQGSVTVPEQPNQTEADEAAALQAAAKISADQARQAALAAVPGTAGNVSLDNENGSVVYSVEITDSSGTVTDVKVDAGNGTVLAKDAGGNEAGGTETPGAPEAPETGATATK
jgi:uncharacterized membrane protein YkoI